MTDRTLPHGEPLPEAAPADRSPARTIGAYRLERRLGEGGMGEVWLAEQTAPVRRQVAVKLIKAGMDSRRVVARFEAERQALALMEHPAIAKVFDGGSTPEGRPYFVMEHVSGVPLNEHCDRERLTTRERLELFVLVCEGVQHAHHKAVIHRDLKPSNVLVTTVDGKPIPKIIDFGIAKAMERPLTEGALSTEVGAVIGTPEYMSPEQIDAMSQDVDTRADVYSLGVMLYELLSGSLPFTSRDLRGSSLEELRRKIREEDPPAPSARLAAAGEAAVAAAASRGTTISELVREVRGDLDAIATKALEKERSRRYGSPAELAADIGRHLRSEPVLARLPTTGYRVGKFVARNRGKVAATAAALLAFAAAGAVALWQARVATRERDRALAQLERAEAMVSFVDLLINEAALAGEKLSLSEFLERSERLALKELHNRPEQQAVLLNSLGSYYISLANHAKAEQLLRRAAELVRSSSDVSLRAHVECNHALAIGGSGEAEPAKVEAAKKAIAAWLSRGDLEPEAAIHCETYLAQIAYMTGDAAGALEHPLRARSLLAGLPRPMPTLEAEVRGDLGFGYHLAGRNDEADREYAISIRLYREQGREDGPGAIAILNNWGFASFGAGDVKRALELGEEVIRLAGRRAPAPPVYALNNRASALLALGRYRDALEEADRTMRVAREAHETLFAVAALATKSAAFAELGDLAMAERTLDEAASLARDLPADSFASRSLVFRRARLAFLRGRPDLARDALQPLVERMERSGARDAMLARALRARAEALGRLADRGSAERDARAALEISQQLQGGKPFSLFTGQSWLLLARLRLDQGDRQGAKAAAEQAVAHLSEMLAGDHPDLGSAREIAAR
jgi:serine/threonine protein kinase